MRLPDTAPGHSAAAPRLPGHAQLSRLVARSLGLDAASLAAGLRPATLDDLPAIVAFRRAHLSKPPAWDDDAYLRWRYRLGREGQGMGDLWCLHRGTQLIALMGTEDLQIELDGERVSGVQAMDLLALPETQDAGLGIWLNQALLARHPFVLAVGANQNSGGIVRRLFEPLAPQRTYTHPLDIGPFVRRRWPAVSALPLAVRAGNAGLALWRFGLRRRQSRDLAVVAALPLDDALLPAPTLPGRVHLLCHGEHLRHRWQDNPRRAFELRQLHRVRTLAGSIAWTLGQDDRGQPELHVVDWHFDREDTFSALLHTAIREAVARHCNCVRLVIQDEAAQRTAARLGFMRSHQDEGRPCGVQSNDPELAARLARATWALTGASDDTDGL